MNISTKIKEAGKWGLVFVILKVLITLIEQLLLYISDTQSYLFYLNVLRELEILLVPCFLFFLITLLTAKWMNRKYYYFVFPIIIFLFLNFVLLFSLHVFEDKMFYMNVPSFAFDNIDYTNNMITDILLCYVKPFYCLIDGGFLSHFNVFYFYILYVINPFVYYLGLSCLCSYVKRKFKKDVIK